MKHFYRMFLVVCVTSWQAAYAAETEPNNTKAQASTLTLNASNSGKINTGGDVDWWKVTTTADGRLDIKLTPVSGKKLWIYLYDNNGITLLKSGNANVTFTQSADGLATGTYYIKVAAVLATDTASYTISNSLIKPAQAADAEPNDTKTTALALLKNATVTGHLGYYYNARRDTSDWYKITTTGDSKLKLKLTPANGNYLSLSLYASNGVSLIGSASGNAAFSLLTNALKKDIYYVKINAKTNTDFAPYTLTDSSITASATDSFVLALNYAYQTKISAPGKANWWRVTTPKNGKLTLTLSSVSGKFVWVYLYDHDRTTVLNSTYTNTKITLPTDGLAAGAYFVKVMPYYATDTATYILADTLTVPAQAADVEPNDAKAQAITFAQNSTKTGHVGYYYNKKRDSADWYKITTTGDGRLDLKLTAANNQYTWVYLYDNDGATLLNSNYTNSSITVSTDGLAAGTYYARVNCYYNTGFAPYTLSNNLVPPAQAADAEPNDTKAQAVTLNVNSTKTGHTGYYYNKRRDSADWYKISTSADGLLNLHLTSANNQYTWVYLYDNDGTTLLNSTYTNTTLKLSTDGLAAGTYYVRVNCYYNTGFAPYTLKDSLFTYSPVTEVEPNRQAFQGKVIATNTTASGHAGFYYKKTRDTLDWWKISYTGSGSLQLKFTLSPRKIDGGIPYVWFYFYKDTLGSPVYASYFNTPSNIISLSSLSKTTYYIKIIPYYNNDFAAYTISNPATAPLTMARPFDGKAIAEETVARTSLAIFPNPARDKFHVQVSGKERFTSVTLTDITGKQVWRQATATLQSNSGFDVDTRRLPGGTYFVTATNEAGKTIMQKVVIVR